MRCLPLMAIVCTAVLCIVVKSWNQCNFLLSFYIRRVPALCSDGRPLHEPLINSNLILDDTEEDNDGQVIMTCFIPVHVYYRRSHDHEQATKPKAEPRSLELEKLRQRQEDVGVMCNRDGHPTMGAFYPHCKAPGWTCVTGVCSGYEKARRLCAAQIRKAPYPCFYVPGDRNAGVQFEGGDEHPELRTLFIRLSLAGVATVWLLQCFCVLSVTIKHDCKDSDLGRDCRSVLENDIIRPLMALGTAWTACAIGSMVFIGFLYCRLVVSVHREPNETAPRGKIPYSLGDLSPADLPKEKPVIYDQTFYILRWSPSSEQQVLLIAWGIVVTMCYQIWFLYTHKHHEYHALPTRLPRCPSVESVGSLRCME